ncbi:MAG: imidazoleglycerol-phosphate dehydratase, partial [Caulobacteraceae bacterium]
MANRTGEVIRETKETRIRVSVDLDGVGNSRVST